MNQLNSRGEEKWTTENKKGFNVRAIVLVKHSRPNSSDCMQKTATHRHVTCQLLRSPCQHRTWKTQPQTHPESMAKDECEDSRGDLKSLLPATSHQSSSILLETEFTFQRNIPGSDGRFHAGGGEPGSLLAFPAAFWFPSPGNQNFPFLCAHSVSIVSGSSFSFEVNSSWTSVSAQVSSALSALMPSMTVLFLILVTRKYLLL